MGRYARELIIEARQNPKLLLERPKFWKPGIFNEFLNVVSSSSIDPDPDSLLDLALQGPAFAEQVASEGGQNTNILKLRAYNVLGTLYRHQSNYTAAEAAFQEADSLEAPAIEHADTARRCAILRIYQGRPAEGHALADKAVQIFSLTSDLFDRQNLGLALSARGYTHYQNARLSESAVDLTAAGGLINYRDKPRAYYDVLHNLTVVMVETINPEDLAKALNHLGACYKRFVSSKHRVAKLKLRWLQALAQKRFGSSRQAERYFKYAFNGFVDLGLPSEVAMISLDIAAHFLDENRYREAQELAANAYKIVKSLGMDTGGLAALNLWSQASSEELTVELLSASRKQFLPHAKPYGHEKASHRVLS